MSNLYNYIDNFFHLKSNKTSLKKEILGGITVFISMSYILFVQPEMIASATGLSIEALFIITALTAGFFTILGGFLSNTPCSYAAGMGMNAFFAFSMVGSGNMSYEQAYGVVFLSGIIFFIITISGLRSKIVARIPKALTKGMTISIGFFITFVGLKNAGIIVGDPDTFVALGDFTSPVFVLGFITIIFSFIFWSMDKKWAIIASIIIGVVVGLIFQMTPWGANNPGLPSLPDSWNYGGWNDLNELIGIPISAFGSKSFWTNPYVYCSIFILFMIDFFDSTANIGAIFDQIEVDNQKQLNNAMLVDALGTIGGSMVGSTSITTYVESLTAPSVGARTGLSAIVTGSFFFLSLLLLPMLSLFAATITTGALVLVGTQMARQMINIDWKDLSSASATFIMIIMTLLTFSVSYGIMFGFITWVATMVGSKRTKEISPLMYALVPIFLAFLVILSLF